MNIRDEWCKGDQLQDYQWAFIFKFASDQSDAAQFIKLYQTATEFTNDELARKIIHLTKQLQVHTPAERFNTFCIETGFLRIMETGAIWEKQELFNQFAWFIKDFLPLWRYEDHQLNDIMELLGYIAAYRDAIQPPQKIQTGVSYRWINNPDEELPELFQKMISTRLIEPDTDQDNFIKVFTGKPLTEINPIRWMSEPVLLAYFVDQLRSVIEIDAVFTLWETAEKCFYVKKKSKLRNIADGYLDNKTKRPKHHKSIDDLF